MDIILIGDAGGQTRKLNISPRSPWFWMPLAAAPAALLACAVGVGYWMAPTQDRAAGVAEATALWDEQVEAQRQSIEALRGRIDDSMKALASRVGKLQAHVTRLNAASERMVHTAGLDPQKFRFAEAPAVGGPKPSQTEPPPSRSAFEARLDSLSAKLDKRERQMNVLRDLMVAGELRSEVMPSGQPVSDAWVSSAYGWRTDPFSAGRSLHEGIDFAAESGSEVVSVAPGVVTTAERKSGYGRTLEINHGNGYVTRYGHNRKLLVSVGDRVKGGEVIARMGSTGRSTGPHVHFEVRKNGDVVNPTEYVQAAR